MMMLTYMYVYGQTHMSKRASEGASEHNCMVRTQTVAKTEATKQKHNCKVRTPKAANTEVTKQKQHTQHRIFISCHPLLFPSIAVCIGVRTAILHRCSHLAFIPPSCIGARTLHSSIAARCLDFFVQLSLEQFAAYHDHI